MEIQASLIRGDPENGSVNTYPNIWYRVNILGKTMWFTVLADLGFNKSAVPNMLINPDLLANLTANSRRFWYCDQGNQVKRDGSQSPEVTCTCDSLSMHA